MDRRRVQSFPFVIGRSADCDLQLDRPAVSNHHAELMFVQGRIHLRDLGSTNGTFLNGQRLGQDAVPLGDSDVIHVVSEEIRMIRMEAPVLSRKTVTQRVVTSALPFDWTRRSSRLIEILDGHLEAWFQPIVDWTRTLIAWEALGRGRVGDLVVSPTEMFLAARENGMELELCRALRKAALKAAVNLPPPRRLFLNAAPEDLEDRDELLLELREFRRRGIEVVVEIHEAAVADPEFMRLFRDELSAIGCGLAFDDFGAGHSRLRELTELHPDYLKFDNSFIRGIDAAPGIRQDLIRLFIGLVRDYGISSVAEGVEREEEATFCREAGFELAQGHLFGRPMPLAER